MGADSEQERGEPEEDGAGAASGGAKEPARYSGAAAGGAGEQRDRLEQLVEEQRERLASMESVLLNVQDRLSTHL